MLKMTRLWLVLLAVVVCSGFGFANMYMGTYMYRAGVPNGDGGCNGDVGVGLMEPVAYTASSALGDGLIESTSVAFGRSSTGFSYLVVRFDFGETCDIDSVDVTSYLQNSYWGMGPLAWAYTLDGSAWSWSTEGDWRYPSHTQNYIQGGGFVTRSFDVNMSVKGIELYIEDNAPYYSNLAEVTFTPEPASMALLAIGGLLTLRRRRA